MLVLSPEPVGERMAGPAIRAAELARALAAARDVTLAAPAPSRRPGEGVRCSRRASSRLRGAARRRARSTTSWWPRSCRPRCSARCARRPVRLVLDLYNPIVIEVLEAVAARPRRAQRRIQALIASRALAQCAAADLIVCATERQRDLWLGGMALQRPDRP